MLCDLPPVGLIFGVKKHCCLRLSYLGKLKLLLNLLVISEKQSKFVKLKTNCSFCDYQESGITTRLFYLLEILLHIFSYIIINIFLC